jgi:hypothetical protein
MSKSDAFESLIIKHIFQNTAVANLGDATGLRGSTTAGSVYISLHTGDPGETGDQTTNEATYTSYARVAVARDGSHWSESAGTISNVLTVTFAACTGGSNTITHFGVGTDPSGAGTLLYSGALTASLAVSNGITPSFAASALTVSEG